MAKRKEEAHGAMGQRNEAEKRKKKPFSSPQLIEYGDVRKLTDGTIRTPGDAHGGKRV